MSKIKFAMLILLSVALVAFSACSQNSGQPGAASTTQASTFAASTATSKKAETTTTAFADTAAAELIVRESVEKGYVVCHHLALAEFPYVSTGYADKGIDGFFKLNYTVDTQDEYSATVFAIMQNLHSVADVEQHYYDAFEEQTAGQLFGRLFTESYVMYKDIDGELHQNGQVSANPIRTYQWNLDEMQILAFSETSIIAEMPTKNVMDEDTGVRQLALIKQNDKWLLTEAFLEV